MGRLVVMADATALLDQQLHQLGRAVLKAGGKVKSAAAKRRAEEQYLRYDRRRKLERQQAADAQIAALAKEAKGLPRSPRG